MADNRQLVNNTNTGEYKSCELLEFYLIVFEYISYYWLSIEEEYSIKILQGEIKMVMATA